MTVMAYTPVDAAWVLLCSFLVFSMQGGFLALEAGLTRTKNSVNVAIKNLSDFGVAVICFWLLGFSLMFGPSLYGLVGTPGTPVGGSDPSLPVFVVFQAMFCGTATTIVSGAVAERMRFAAYLATAVVTSLVVYPIVGHWAWNGLAAGRPEGWLGALGFVDFSGSTVVHSVGGWISLAAILILGPGIGRFPENEAPRRFSGSNVPMSVLGVIILWLGWFGFNAGNTHALNADVPRIALNTMLGGSGGLIGAILYQFLLRRVQNVLLSMNGCLCGLVAITAGCLYIEPWAALLVGLLAAPVMAIANLLLERYRIDDAVGAVPVHLGGGIWGTVAVGLFGELERIGTGLSRVEQIAVQLLGIGATAVVAFGIGGGLLWLLNRRTRMRVPEWAEVVGCRSRTDM